MPKKVPKICIVDYGRGNIRSVINSLEFSTDCNVCVSDNKKELDSADILILPGVGSFSDAIGNLHELDLFDKLNEEVINRKKPLMAICLGMQLVMDSSEEGGLSQGFGWIPGDVTRINTSNEYRLPHMGWDNIQIKKRSDLFKGIEQNPDFYFVHSYHVDCEEEYVVASCNYGYEFPVAIQKDNVVAFQFHPEKSHKNGLRLLTNYVDGIKEKL
jgi:imidazole glycerol-phosphate synthase subunit HisH